LTTSPRQELTLAAGQKVWRLCSPTFIHNPAKEPTMTHTLKTKLVRVYETDGPIHGAMGQILTDR
jgi:hypothetical protein